MFSKITAYLKSLPAETSAIAICVLVLFWVTACVPKVDSINGKPKQVTRAELEIEIERFVAVAELRFRDLQQQEEFRQAIFNNAVLWAQGGAINPIGLITTLGTIFGIGAAVDSAKSRKKLKAFHIE